VYLKR